MQFNDFCTPGSSRFTQRMEKYVDMCKMVELPNSIKIKVDCPMCWNSTFRMLERALAKREVLDHMAVRFLSTSSKEYALCQEDWDLIKEYLSILGPLCEGSYYAYSAKRLPITEVTSLFSDLMSQLEQAMYSARATLDEERREALRSACSAMYNKLMQYAKVIWGNHTVATAGTLDPFSKIGVVHPSYREDVLSYLGGLLDSTCNTSAIGCDSEQDESSRRRRPDHFVSTKRQYTHPCKTRRPRATPRQELDKYLNIPCSEEEARPLSWWKDVGTRYFPNLTKIASRFLAISPTSAPAERLFSIGRGITTYRRGRLDVDNIETRMMLRAWFRRVEQCSSDS
ncbi:uncharacterized protein LOC144707843 [Wolffia australiana]